MVRSYKKEWMAKNRSPKPTAITPKQKKEINKLINKKIDNVIEDKYYELDSNGAVQIDWNATTSVIDITSSMIRGDDDNDFAGACIKPKYCDFRFRINTVAAGGYAVRVMFIQMKANVISTGPNTFSGTANTRSTLSFWDTDFNNTYRVLSDRTYTLVNGQENTFYQGKIELKRLSKIYFQRSAAGVTPPLEKGGIYAVFISDVSNALANRPQLEYRSLLVYEDA